MSPSVRLHAFRLLEPERRTAGQGGQFAKGGGRVPGRAEGGTPADAQRNLEAANATRYEKARENRENRELDAAVDDYCEEGYNEINGELRGRANPGSLTELPSDTRKTVEQLDYAFVQLGHTTDADSTVYREVEPEVFGARGAGATFRDLAYTSTTTVQEGVFEGGKPNVTIHIPKGTRVLAGSLTEDELVLRRGSVFKILSADRGNYVLELTP